jgi:hypothetical protein
MKGIIIKIALILISVRAFGTSQIPEWDVLYSHGERITGPMEYPGIDRQRDLQNRQ